MERLTEQAARLGAESTDAGVDLAIGEAEMLGRGIGSHVLRVFVERVILADPTITACISDPEERNTRSVRAFEKAGFVTVCTVCLEGETTPRRVVRLGRAALNARDAR